MSSLTKQWMTFFKEAGITNVTSAALYASNFAENEMTTDMVGDLTREILKEMGITLMGHVLAILKHAKAVHTEALTNKIVAKTSNTSVKGIVSPFAESSPEEVRPEKTITAPAMRIIEHYVQRPTEYEAPPPQQMKTTMRQVSAAKKQTATVSTSRIKDRLSIPMKASPASGLKVTDRLGIKKAVQINNDIVPVKKNRRVLPEQEGGYKITMPLGTTPKTKQLLAKQSRDHTQSKATVFERLGNSDSSSESEPKVTITGLGNLLVRPSKSVFSRLGDRNEVTSTVTSDEPPVQTRLGYRGVLKADTQQPKQISAMNRISTMKHIAFEGSAKPSAMSRLGKSTSAVTSQADSSQSAKGSGILAKPITKRKKFVLVKKSGAREIVYRDVPDYPAPKRTHDAATRNMFRSDNIAVVPGIASRLGQEIQEEQEWDY